MQQYPVDHSMLIQLSDHMHAPMAAIVTMIHSLPAPEREKRVAILTECLMCAANEAVTFMAEDEFVYLAKTMFDQQRQQTQ